MFLVKADEIGESCLDNSANCPGAANCADGIHCSCSVGWVATEIGECVEGKPLYLEHG